jgi:predicted alpha/beta-hydrolase family hydrolase
MEIATPSGPALVDLDEPGSPVFLLVMTHGSNGGVATPDLLAVRAVALEMGAAVARVLQPFRVAGRRAPGPAAKQDQAWLTVVGVLRERFGDLPLILCGRSNGARVACRTALELSALGVLALAYPLHPPGRPERSRADELYQAGVEVVVVNGERDPFGVPDAAAGTHVHVLPGEGHGLAGDPSRVGAVVAPWLRRWSGGDPG